MSKGSLPKGGPPDVLGDLFSHPGPEESLQVRGRRCSRGPHGGGVEPAPRPTWEALAEAEPQRVAS